MEALERERARGETAFRLKFQNDATAATESVLKEEWLTFGVPPDSLRVRVCGCDFNISTKTTADYTAFVCLGLDESGAIWILDLFRSHLASGHADAVESFFLRNGGAESVAAVAVEATAFQSLIAEQLVHRPTLVPVVKVEPTKDKLTRALDWQPYAQSGRFKASLTIPHRDALVAEWRSFPLGAHDDIIDAIGHAMLVLKAYVRTPASGESAAVARQLDDVYRDYGSPGVSGPSPLPVAEGFPNTIRPPI